MPLKSDEQGFLVGIPIEVSSVMRMWKDIQRDVKAIKQALNPNARSNKPAPATSAERKQQTKDHRGNSAVVAREKKSEQRDKAVSEKTANKNQAVKRQVETPKNREFTGAKQTLSNDSLKNVKKTTVSGATSVGEGSTAGRQKKRTSGKTSGPEVNDTGRDARGRFVAKPKSITALGDESRRTSNLASKIAAAVKEGEENLQETDPTIKAMQEIATPLARGYESLFGQEDSEETGWLKKIWRSFNAFRKDEKKADKEQDKRLKAIEKKKPVSIGGSIRGGLDGVLGGLKGFGGVALAALPKLLKKIPLIGAAVTGLGAVFNLFSDEGNQNLTREEKTKRHGKTVGGAAGALGGMLGGAKLGAMIGALGGPIGSAIGAAVGGIAGGFFGDSAGSIIGEKVGEFVNFLTAADIPGKITGVWNTFTGSISAGWNTLTAGFQKKWDEVTASISSKWEALTKSVKDIWDTVTKPISAMFGKAKEVVNEVTDKAKEGLNAANNLIEEKTGINVKEAAGNIANNVSETYSGVKDKAKGLWNSGRKWLSRKTDEVLGRENDFDKQLRGDKPREKGILEDYREKGLVSRIVDGVKKGAEQTKDFVVKDTFLGRTVSNVSQKLSGSRSGSGAGSSAGSSTDWTLGSTSQRFESGKGGAGTVSSGKGDAGGVSYGTYQLASKTGTLQKFLRESPYGEQFQGLTPGTKEFNAKWKEVAKNDPNFGAAQHDFIKRTHYDVAAKNLQANGIDLSGRGKAVQDALWSTSVQFGAGNRKGTSGAAGMFKKALKGKDVENMSDAEIVSALQDYKIQNNERLFRKSSAAVRAGTLSRAYEEKKRLLELAQSDSGRASPSAAKAETASPAPVVKTQPAAAPIPAPAPVAQPQPVAPPVEEAPKAPTVVSTSSTKVKTVNADGPIQQDVRDRRIAHIITGGLSDGGGF